MKKPIILGILLCIVALAAAQNYQVMQSDYTQVRLNFSTPQPTVRGITILGESFTSITMEDFYAQSAVGQPALPTMVKMVEVPLGNGLTYNVETMVCDTIEGSELGIGKAIVPAQPSRSKSDNRPSTLAIDRSTYSSNAFCGAPVVELEEVGVARNRNMALVKFNPVRWNPVTNQLIIVKNITVTIRQQNADIAATKAMQRLHASPAFNSSVQAINSLGGKDNYTSAPLRYTIIAHSSFRGDLDDFAAWKRRKGFIVDLVYTDDANVGSTTTSIKNYLQGLYDNATVSSPAPTYVLFVGDVAQVPAFYLTAYGEQQYSDLSYCCWTGNDNIPDCYYGRFSAQNINQLAPQISKTLMYEQYTFPDPSYLSTAALIAGVDAGYNGDNAYKYGDPAMDYAAKLYVTSANGFNNIVYYKNNTSFAPTSVTVTGSSQSSGTAAALRTLYNNGCGWVNYTAHGSETSWGSPSLTTSDVSQMTNYNKPMVMIGNCCLTNSFQVDACLGEALLRKGENAGAVGYIGGSNSTYWTEDFYWSVGIRSNISNTMNTNYDATHLGMYDRLFHSHNEAYSDWYFTMGSMIQAGNMAVEASTTSSGMKEYYWQIYHLMGDPSLMPYYHGQAATMTANVPSATSVGSSTLNITAVPYAYIAFSDESHNLVAAAFADANGNVTLHFDALANPGTYEVVITAQGYRPFIQNVNVIANGPYINTTSMTANGTLIADCDIDFNVTLQNLGVEDASTLSIEFQSIDGTILIDTTGIIDLGTGLSRGSELTINSVCHGHIWGHVTDQTVAPIRVIVRWGNTVDDMSSTTYYFTVNADNLRMKEYSYVNDIDSTGTVSVSISNKNFGHATLQNATISLISLDPVFDVVSPTTQSYSVSNVAVDDEASYSFTLSLTGPAPQDRVIPLIQLINNGFRTSKDTVQIVIGHDNSLITFEDNTWGNSQWIHGTYPWQIVNQEAYDGTHCAKSYNCGHGNSSELSITWTSTMDDSLTFYKNVSSENNYDFFRFYIDGTLAEELSGTNNSWSRSAYFVTQGTHTFKFSYEKDGSVSRGSDCAWIDNLHLPLSGILYTYILDSTCQGAQYEFRDSIINTEGLSAGVHHFCDSSETGVCYLTLVLTPAPEVSISGGDVTIRAGETVRLTASGADSYIWSSGETSAIIDVYPTETTIYTVTGYNGNCSSSASTTITVEGSIGIDGTLASLPAINVYPNPAHNSVTVESATMNQLTLTDITGRTIIDTPVYATRYTFNISTLANGIYFIRTTHSDGSRSTAKIIKK